MPTRRHEPETRPVLEQLAGGGVRPSLTERVVLRVASDHLAGVIRSEIRAGFQRLESLVADLLETTPSPAESLLPGLAQSLPTIFAAPLVAHHDRFDIHVVRDACRFSGSNGLFRPLAL